MATQAAVDILIDEFIDNYGVKAFHNMNLNRILHLINGNSGMGGLSTDPPAGYFPTIFVTQADFTTATDCPVSALNGYNLAVFYNDASKYLKKGTEWQILVGGGFTILLSGFDATLSGFTATFALTPALV